MSTNDIPQHEHDDRAPAVLHAETGAAGWRAAAGYQPGAAPEHGDFYAIAGELTEAARAMGDLASVLALQVANYGRNRVLRDDEPGHDPAERLDAAWSLACQLSHELGRVERTADRFWSTVGHIGVEPTGGPADGPGGPADGEVPR